MHPHPYSQFCALLFVKRDRQVGGTVQGTEHETSCTADLESSPGFVINQLWYPRQVTDPLWFISHL